MGVKHQVFVGTEVGVVIVEVIIGSIFTKSSSFPSAMVIKLTGGKIGVPILAASLIPKQIRLPCFSKIHLI
jgi:hypothetical protein